MNPKIFILGCSWVYYINSNSNTNSNSNSNSNSDSDSDSNNNTNSNRGPKRKETRAEPSYANI